MAANLLCRANRCCSSIRFGTATTLGSSNRCACCHICRRLYSPASTKPIAALHVPFNKRLLTGRFVVLGLGWCQPWLRVHCAAAAGRGMLGAAGVAVAAAAEARPLGIHNRTIPMSNRLAFHIDPRWSFSRFLDELFSYYRGSGIESTGRRLSTIRLWMSMAGRARALAAIQDLEREAEGASDDEIAQSLWMSLRSYKDLKRWANRLPSEVEMAKPPKAFISYKWDSGAHVAWVRTLAADLRGRGIEAILDQWEVQLGDSFTDYMQKHIAESDVILFVITPSAVAAAEAPIGQGGALKFEVQMMNARRIAEGTRIIGIYRAGDRPPNYLRDHRYADFRDDAQYEQSLTALVDDLLGKTGPPPIGGAQGKVSPVEPQDQRAPEGDRLRFNREQLERLLQNNRHRDAEVTNGLWSAGPPITRIPLQALGGPIRVGLIQDETFELKIPCYSNWSLAVPYEAVRRAWLTTDQKVSFLLELQPVLYSDGFHLETESQ